MADLIGTILLLGITVAGFSVLSIAVLDQFDRNPPPKNIEFRVDTIDERTTIIAVWGESLPVDDTRLIFQLDNVRTTRNLDVAPLSTNLTHRPTGSLIRWDVGEPLRMACPVGERCAYPGQRVTNISIVQISSNFVVFSSEPGVSRGAIVNPVADLVVNIDSLVDPARPSGDPPFTIYRAAAGGTVRVTATISNGGILSTPTGTTLDVGFYLDANPVPFHTATHSDFLAPGDFFTTQNTPITVAPGNHNIRVQVVATPSFLEAGYTNNERIQPFSVVTGVFDPGFPYEDSNNDILYNPYWPTPVDVDLPMSSVRDGDHTVGGGRGLVIPPSVGAITISSRDMVFRSDDGKLTIGVNLVTTSGRSITLDAETDFELRGSVDVTSARFASIVAKGKLDISGDRFSANDRDITVRTTSGPLLGLGSVFYIGGLPVLIDDVVIEASAGRVDLEGATFDVYDDITIRSRGPLNIEDASITTRAGLGSRISLNLYVSTNTVFIDGVRIVDGDNCANVDPDTVPSANIIGVSNPPGRVKVTCP